jgi:hypothetical protein
MLAAISLSLALALGLPAVTTGVADAGPVPTTFSCATSPVTSENPGVALSCVNATAAGDSTPPASLMPNSLFNQDVTSWPVAHDSGAIVAEFNDDWRTNYGSVGVNTRPVVWVPAGQPMVPLSVQAGCDNFRAETGSSAPIPPWAPRSGPGDEILTVYQPSSNSVWEFWQARRVTPQPAAAHAGSPVPANGWSACWAGKALLNTFSGVFPSPFGETATGISNLATEVTEADVLSGSINHAIGLQVVNCTTFIYPADRGDCNHDPGTPAEGQWFRFAPSVNCADYDSTPFENEVCLAGQQRGFVVVDHGGSDGIEADFASGTWTDEGHPGPAGTWQRTAGGACCIFAGGAAPLERSLRTGSGTYEQEYQVIAGLPWNELQVIVPPHR